MLIDWITGIIKSIKTKSFVSYKLYRMPIYFVFNYAVIEPDARTRAFMKRGLTAGTVPGEAWRFFFQFKAFPIAVLQKAFGREMSFIKDGQNAKGLFGIANLIVGAGIFGYIAMTAKDILKGKSPKDPAKLDTFYAEQSTAFFERSNVRQRLPRCQQR